MIPKNMPIIFPVLIIIHLSIDWKEEGKMKICPKFDIDTNYQVNDMVTCKTPFEEAGEGEKGASISVRCIKD
jgi:hypothetical protein